MPYVRSTATNSTAIADLGAGSTFQAPFTTQNAMWWTTNPIAGNVIVCGVDTYEFQPTATAISNDTYIGVLIGGSNPASRINFMNAMNGVGTGIADGILAVGGGGPLLLENGTEDLLAVDDPSYIYAFVADAPGGNKVPGGIHARAFSATLAGGPGWIFGNTSGCIGFAGGSRRNIMFSVKMSAQMISDGDVQFLIPFTLDIQSLVTMSVVDNNGEAVVRNETFSSLNGAFITLNFNGGVAPNMQSSDTVTFEVWE